MTDSDLLRRYAQQHDSSAFAELAKRHLDFVYATARRLLHGDAHGAEDVCQQVFIDLARKAPALVTHPCLAGWLHACARFNAINTIRRDHRRLSREHAAEAMHEIAAPAADWDRIRPMIDDVLEELDERDRHFVLLRFFRQQSIASIAQQFQVSENTVQKAVSRALDLLNAGLSQRGITSTSAALAIAMTQSAKAAPATLLPAVTKLALAASAAPTVSVLAGLKLGATLAAASGLALGVGYWTATQRQLAANLNETAAMEQRHRVELHRLQVRIDEEKRRAATAESEISTLLTAIERARNEQQQLAAAASRAAAAAAQARPIPAGPERYVIKPGDGGARIAASQGVSLAELAAANPGVNWARLRVGQQINLPPRSQPREAVSPATPLPDLSAASDFVVRPGDTLGAILLAARITLSDVQRLNPDLVPERLVAGQRIRLR